MSTSVKLSKDEHGKCIDSTLYRSLIGSLMMFVCVPAIKITLKIVIYFALKEL